MSKLSQFMPPGYVEWQAVKTASFTAEKSKAYPVNTTSNVISVTFPASATRGDTIVLLDYTRTWHNNNVTVLRNGLKIQGGTYDATLDKRGSSYTYVYIDATEGWVPQIEILEATDKGTFIAAGNQNYFSTGSYTWTVPATVTECCVVVVGAGGKSGIGNSGQAAGGGALAYKNAITVVPGQTASIVVGSPGNHSGNNGNAGGNSSFTYGGVSVTAGGGGGGQGNASDSTGLSPGDGGATSGSVTGGGNGGNGGYDAQNFGGPGGGGAGGYAGNGGDGASTGSAGSQAVAGSSGAGGGGGGGGKGGQSEVGGGGGGGVGMYGQGTSGAGGTGHGQNANVGGGGGAGSGGSAGGSGQGASGGQGGNYGGGHAGPQGGGTSNTGAQGAVRVVWGTGRSFPNNAAQV